LLKERKKYYLERDAFLGIDRKLTLVHENI